MVLGVGARAFVLSNIPSPFFSYYCYNNNFFETGFYCAVQAGLKLLCSQAGLSVGGSPPVSLPGARITRVHHHALLGLLF